MREDYKKSLIDYVTNLLDIENPRPTDFDPNESTAGVGTTAYDGQWWQDIVAQFDGKAVSINGILDNPNYNTVILYGGYQEGNSGNSKGFLIYVDKYNRPTKARLLNTRGFQFLKFDETNNRVYGVSGDRSNNAVADDNDAYFVYYNNLFLTESDDNPPVLTYSYKIHEDSGTNYFMARDIVKHPEKSWYIIYATNYSGLINTRVVELQINVGQANELKTWNIGSSYFSYAFYGWYSGDTPHFKAITLNSNASYDFILATDNGDNVSYTTLTCDTTIKRYQVSSVRPNYIATSEEKIYFIYNSSYTEDEKTMKQCFVYHYDGTTEVKTVYQTTAYDYADYVIPMFNLVNDTNTVYGIRLLPYYDADESKWLSSVKYVNLSNHDTPTEDDFYSIGSYADEMVYPYRFNVYNFITRLRRDFNIIYFNSFCGYMREGLGNYNNNLNGFTKQAGVIVQKIGYTGYPYSSYSVLVPRYLNMYYMSVALWFSRNVYNITRFNNTTTASVEVPAGYFKDFAVARSKLFGNTNVELVRHQQVISNNEYEILHINFINTINVIDEDTSTYYDLGAIKVNNGITTGTQTSYEDTRGIKYRINYADDTTAINNVVWSDIDDLHKQTSFSIYVDKPIKNIDLISNDESTIYLTINGTFIEGKNYIIRQKVRVE